MNRLNLLSLIAAGSVALGCAVSTHARAADSVKVGVFPISSSLPYFVAIEQGYFKELNIELPGLLPAAGTYVAAKRHNDLVYVSGHGPLALDQLPASSGEPYAVDAVLGALVRGKLGSDLSLQEGKAAARSVGLLLLATLRSELGSLDEVRSVLKVFGMVNCTPDFLGAAAVIDLTWMVSKPSTSSGLRGSGPM